MQSETLLIEAPATVETPAPAAPERAPYLSPYEEDARRLRAGLTCGKCDSYHAPWRCPACD